MGHFDCFSGLLFSALFKLSLQLERESRKAAERSSRGVTSVREFNQTENEGNKILSGPDAASSPPESEMETGDRTSALVPGTAEVDSRVDLVQGNDGTRETHSEEFGGDRKMGDAKRPLQRSELVAKQHW